MAGCGIKKGYQTVTPFADDLRNIVHYLVRNRGAAPSDKAIGFK